MNTTASYSSEHSWLATPCHSRRGSIESELSIQGKETDFVRDTSDTDCASSDKGEYEPFTEPEEDGPIDSNLSSGPSDEEHIIKTKVIEVSVADDGDIEFADSEKTGSDCSDSELDLYDYWKCAQCHAENNTPLYRFCEKCFKVRKSFFPPRPRKRKNNRNRVTAVPRAWSFDSGVESTFNSQELSQHTDLSQRTELSQPTELSQQTEFSELSQPTELSQAAELNEPIELGQPTELSDVVELSQPTELSQATDVNEPIELGEVVELSQPTELSQATHLSQQTELSGLVELSQPTEFSQATDLSQPTELGQTTEFSQLTEFSKVFELHQRADLGLPFDLSQPTNQEDHEGTSSTQKIKTNNVILHKPRKRRAESADRYSKRLRLDSSDSESDSDIEPRHCKAKSAEPEVSKLIKTVSDPAITFESTSLTAKAIINSLKEKIEDSNLCIICYAKPKSAVFVHGRIAHICTCYECGNMVWRKAKRCPQCNCKVSNVLKVM